MAGLIECGVCKRTFSRKEGLIKHFRKQHENNLIACGHCDKSFISHEELERHREAVKKIRKQYKCFKCESTFTREYLRKAHEAQKHAPVSDGEEKDDDGDDADAREIFCNVCGRKYKKRFWYAHQKSIFHMENLMRDHKGQVRVFESAFKDQIRTYQVIIIFFPSSDWVM